MLDWLKEKIQNLFGEKHKTIYMFFNCDAEKSSTSMNPRYNAVVYEDRDVLCSVIIANLMMGQIKINEEDLDTVKDIILNGDPTQANDYIRYGCLINVALMK